MTNDELFHALTNYMNAQLVVLKVVEQFTPFKDEVEAEFPAFPKGR